MLFNEFFEITKRNLTRCYTRKIRGGIRQGGTPRVIPKQLLEESLMITQKQPMKFPKVSPNETIAGIVVRTTKETHGNISGKRFQFVEFYFKCNDSSHSLSSSIFFNDSSKDSPENIEAFLRRFFQEFLEGFPRKLLDEFAQEFLHETVQNIFRDSSMNYFRFLFFFQRNQSGISERTTSGFVSIILLAIYASTCLEILLSNISAIYERIPG